MDIELPMDIELTLQRPDFSSPDTEVFSKHEILERIRLKDWSGEIIAFAQRIVENKNACPPSVYLEKSAAYRLHLFATSDDEYHVLIMIQRPKKLLGLIPYTSTQELWRFGENLESVMNFIEQYIDNDAERIVEKSQQGIY